MINNQRNRFWKPSNATFESHDKPGISFLIRPEAKPTTAIRSQSEVIFSELVNNELLLPILFLKLFVMSSAKVLKSVFISGLPQLLLRRNGCEVSVDLRIVNFIFDNIKTNLNDWLEKKMPSPQTEWDIHF